MSTNSEYIIREIRTPVAITSDRSGIRLRSALARLRAAIFAALRRAHQRARLRHELARLDARQLRDIGCTREDLEIEAAKPFWRE